MMIQNRCNVAMDAGAELALYEVKEGKTEHDQAEAARNADNARQDHAESQEVDEMHEKATEIRAYAVGSAACDFASAGLSVASVSTSANHVDTSKYLQIGSSNAQATGSLVGQLGNAQSADKDAEIAVAKENADHAAQQADRRKDDSKAASDFIDKALDFYKEWNEGQAQASQAALHRA